MKKGDLNFQEELKINGNCESTTKLIDESKKAIKTKKTAVVLADRKFLMIFRLILLAITGVLAWYISRA